MFISSYEDGKDYSESGKYQKKGVQVFWNVISHTFPFLIPISLLCLVFSLPRESDDAETKEISSELNKESPSTPHNKTTSHYKLFTKRREKNTRMSNLDSLFYGLPHKFSNSKQNSL